MARSLDNGEPEKNIELNYRIREGFLGKVMPALISKDKKQVLASVWKDGCTGGWSTWKTLMRAWGKLSKLLRRTSVSSKSYLPPKSCMPSRAKMTMKRKSSNSREAMERMELSRDATRLLSDVQYLSKRSSKVGRRQNPLTCDPKVWVGLGERLKTDGCTREGLPGGWKPVDSWQAIFSPSCRALIPVGL
jgi:hypothetical protein